MFPNLSAVNPEAFKIYAICSAILAILMIFLASATAINRGKNKSPASPEDAGKPKETAPEVDHPVVLRAKRVHGNAMENIPMFWVIGLVFVLAGAPATGAKAYFITFTAARFLHAFFYFKGLQPFRTISFGIGTLCILGMATQILMAAFRG